MLSNKNSVELCVKLCVLCGYKLRLLTAEYTKEYAQRTQSIAEYCRELL